MVGEKRARREERSRHLSEPLAESATLSNPAGCTRGTSDRSLRRGSLLEAAEHLHRARGRAFQLWAAGEGVDYPGFGLTSLLDAAAAALPPSVEGTYPPPRPRRWRRRPATC